MGPCRHEVAHILQSIRDQLPTLIPNGWKRRTLYALLRCRTVAMGGHIDRCDHGDCGALHISYNSCRNRHCPKCQGHLRERWIARREADLLNTTYFHVVFTLPAALHGLALAHPRRVYNLLFATAWSVMEDFGANPRMLGARMGMIAILHTWGQNLSLHPHLHCLVPAGGITERRKWKTTRSKGRFLFPVKAMSRVFRARFVAVLNTERLLDPQLTDGLFARPWVVYAKQPFLGPRQVVEYLGRYTHRVAISNSRIKDLTGGQVTFRGKDYRKKGAPVIHRLAFEEFIRRFALHILPKGYTRIRHYGILNGRVKAAYKKEVDQQLGAVTVPDRSQVPQHRICPVCRKGKLQTIMVFDQRGPPDVGLVHKRIENK
jgi:hypothetical protein